MFELASLVGVSLSRLLVVPSRSMFVKLHPSNDADDETIHDPSLGAVFHANTSSIRASVGAR